MYLKAQNTCSSNGDNVESLLCTTTATQLSSCKLRLKNLYILPGCLSTNDHRHFDNLTHPIKHTLIRSSWWIWRSDLPRFMQLVFSRAERWTQQVSLESLRCPPSCLLRATDSSRQLANNAGGWSAFFPWRVGKFFYSVVMERVHPGLSSSKANFLVHAT